MSLFSLVRRPRGARTALAALSLTGLAVAMSAGTALAAPAAGAANGAPVQPRHIKTQAVCNLHTRAGVSHCLAIRQVNNVEPTVIRPRAVTPDATPNGYGPSDLQSAYALPSSSAGSGQVVAIVDAYDDPNAESDLGTYRSQYGLPACTTANGCFKKVSQTGSTTSFPPANTGWAGEISLDLDMVSAICPNCKIVLVEATSNSNANLGIAENQAVTQGAKYVSNSYGGGESSSETSTESSYYRHPGVVITASSGDSDYGAEFPATSQYVIAVGGTSLSRNSSPRGWGEVVWKTSSTEGTGSGCSAYIPKPSFQTSVNTGCSRRAEADVSMDADPATGVAVYQTYGGSGWAVYGGTSASAPMVASVYALAAAGGGTGYGNDLPYAHPGNLNDVTSGNNGSCSPSVLCTAGAGWDGPTGLGTPNGIAAFRNGGGSTSVTVANPGSKSSAVGTAVSLQLSASGGTAPYTWTATGLPPGLSISSSGLISGTPTTAGTYSVTATAKDSAGASGSATFSWTITAGGSSCSGQLLANPGFESGAASWTQSNTQIIGSWASQDEPAHTGSYSAWLDGYGSTHTDTLSQSVTIPAGCHGTLSYYLHIDTSESGSTAYDKLSVKAGSTTLATYSNVNAASGYTKHTVSISASGSAVTITFTGTEDSSLQTSFVLDDTAVNLS